jgi:hypothetical protein
VRLRELAADGDGPVAEGGEGAAQGGSEPVRRLEGDQGARVVPEGGEETLPLAGAAGEEAQVGELTSGNAGRDERGRQRGRPGHGHDIESGLDSRDDEVEARVGDDGRATLGYERDVALAQGGEDAGYALRLVVVGVGEEAVPYSMVREQLAGRARVLRRDERDLTEDAQGAQGDILSPLGR